MSALIEQLERKLAALQASNRKDLIDKLVRPVVERIAYRGTEGPRMRKLRGRDMPRDRVIDAAVARVTTPPGLESLPPMLGGLAQCVELGSFFSAPFGSAEHMKIITNAINLERKKYIKGTQSASTGVQPKDVDTTVLARFTDTGQAYIDEPTRALERDAAYLAEARHDIAEATLIAVQREDRAKIVANENAVCDRVVAQWSITLVSRQQEAVKLIRAGLSDREVHALTKADRKVVLPRLRARIAELERPHRTKPAYKVEGRASAPGVVISDTLDAQVLGEVESVETITDARADNAADSSSEAAAHAEDKAAEAAAEAISGEVTQDAADAAAAKADAASEAASDAIDAASTATAAGAMYAGHSDAVTQSVAGGYRSSGGQYAGAEADQLVEGWGLIGVADSADSSNYRRHTNASLHAAPHRRQYSDAELNPRAQSSENSVKPWEFRGHAQPEMTPEQKSDRKASLRATVNAGYSVSSTGRTVPTKRATVSIVPRKELPLSPSEVTAAAESVARTQSLLRRMMATSTDADAELPIMKMMRAAQADIDLRDQHLQVARTTLKLSQAKVREAREARQRADAWKRLVSAAARLGVREPALREIKAMCVPAGLDFGKTLGAFHPQLGSLGELLTESSGVFGPPDDVGGEG